MLTGCSDETELEHIKQLKQELMDRVVFSEGKKHVITAQYGIIKKYLDKDILEEDQIFKKEFVRAAFMSGNLAIIKDLKDAGYSYKPASNSRFAFKHYALGDSIDLYKNNPGFICTTYYAEGYHTCKITEYNRAFDSAAGSKLQYSDLLFLEDQLVIIKLYKLSFAHRPDLFNKILVRFESRYGAFSDKVNPYTGTIEMDTRVFRNGDDVIALIEGRKYGNRTLFDAIVYMDTNKFATYSAVIAKNGKLKEQEKLRKKAKAKNEMMAFMFGKNFGDLNGFKMGEVIPDNHKKHLHCDKSKLIAKFPSKAEICRIPNSFLPDNRQLYFGGVQVDNYLLFLYDNILTKLVIQLDHSNNYSARKKNKRNMEIVKNLLVEVYGKETKMPDSMYKDKAWQYPPIITKGVEFESTFIKRKAKFIKEHIPNYWIEGNTTIIFGVIMSNATLDYKHKYRYRFESSSCCNDHFYGIKKGRIDSNNIYLTQGLQIMVVKKDLFAKAHDQFYEDLAKNEQVLIVEEEARKAAIEAKRQSDF